MKNSCFHYITFLFVFLVACISLTGCFSLMKADHMVYAGSFGKKLDMAIVDTLVRIDVNTQTDINPVVRE